MEMSKPNGPRPLRSADDETPCADDLLAQVWYAGLNKRPVTKCSGTRGGSMMTNAGKVLVTGATGNIGLGLIPVLRGALV